MKLYRLETQPVQDTNEITFVILRVFEVTHCCSIAHLFTLVSNTRDYVPGFPEVEAEICFCYFGFLCHSTLPRGKYCSNTIRVWGNVGKY